MRPNEDSPLGKPMTPYTQLVMYLKIFEFQNLELTIRTAIFRQFHWKRAQVPVAFHKNESGHFW